ncbi:MAG TPA: Ref family recombination enhancement nuclease [Eoetvoesiella sp.]
MKGRPTTPAQKLFHGQLCRHIGCIACALDGHFNDYCSVHHIDGRVKPWAHWFVLPLCAGHHQDGTGAPGLLAVHPWKTRFEVRYGTQPQLLTLCLDRLETEQGIVVPDARLAANGEFWKMVA